MAAQGGPGTKQYLGDGVYAQWDSYYVIVTTENGVEVTNAIYLDPKVMAALRDYAEKMS